MSPVRRIGSQAARAVAELGRDRVADAVRSIVSADAEPLPIGWDPDDPGWFEPDSAVRKVHGDSSGFIGGVRSLLIQSLHPPTVFAVCEHSAYNEDPLGRLQRTAGFLGATTFGKGSEAEQAVAIVRAIHSRVTGTLPDGTPYVADDPHHLGWVHITELDSFLTAYRLYGAEPLSDAEADEYVSEMARVGLALGMTDAPGSVRELNVWLDRYRPELATTPESEDIVRFLLSAPGPAYAKGPYALIFAAALGTLPPWARNMLLLPMLPGTEPFLVRPAAQFMTRTLRWALTPDFEEAKSA